MWCSSTVEGFLAGIFTALLPGLHPLLFSYSSDVAASVAHGLYSSLSVIPSTFLGAFSVSTAYTAVVAHRLVSRGKGAQVVLLYLAGALAGILLTLVYFPLATLLSFRAPHFLVFSVLLYVSVLAVVCSRKPAVAALLALFYSLYGLVVLKLPLPVRHPLTVAISGLFGASSVLVAALSEQDVRYGKCRGVDWPVLLRGAVFGLISAFLISYFPAISVSLAAFIIEPVLRARDEEMVVASGSVATSSLLLTAYGKNFGMVRSSFAAALPDYVYLPRVWAAVAFGACIGVFLALVLAPSLYRFYSSRRVKLLSLLFVAALAYTLSGVPGVLLSLSSTLAGVLTHVFGVEKRVAMFFLLAPTLLYYAPV